MTIVERRPPFIHAKVLMVDDQFTLVGSANLDMRSLRLNYETDLAVFSEAFADEIRRIVFEDLSMSDPLSLRAWRARPVYRRLAENMCSLLTPVL